MMFRLIEQYRPVETRIGYDVDAAVDEAHRVNIALSRKIFEDLNEKLIRQVAELGGFDSDAHIGDFGSVKWIRDKETG
jgi:hypothetical protein